MKIYSDENGRIGLEQIQKACELEAKFLNSLRGRCNATTFGADDIDFDIDLLASANKDNSDSLRVADSDGSNSVSLKELKDFFDNGGEIYLANKDAAVEAQFVL